MVADTLSNIGLDGQTQADVAKYGAYGYLTYFIIRAVSSIGVIAYHQ